MSKNKLSGFQEGATHTTFVKMSEQDKKRHKKHCIYYVKRDEQCYKKGCKCCDVSHCREYTEETPHKPRVNDVSSLTYKPQVKTVVDGSVITVVFLGQKPNPQNMKINVNKFEKHRLFLGKKLKDTVKIEHLTYLITDIK